VRDNLKGILYTQTAASPMWTKIDIPKAVQQAAADGGGVRYTPVEVMAPVSMTWAVDRTGMVAQGDGAAAE